MSDKRNRPTIFRSRVALEVADMTKPRNLAGAKLFIGKKLLENKRTKYESDEVESYWQTVRAKMAINIAKSHHKLQKVFQKTVNLLCEGESRKRMRPDDEVFSNSKDCKDDDKINSHTVYEVKYWQETENSSGNESDDNQNDEVPKDCLRNWMDNEDDELETKNFRKYVDESYAKTRNNNIMKFV
ncbi:hypothetical protein GLOIN_2v1487264 [Rhizophagus irregularis DAOM 181602=DAOM 197198]|uniref:Uncharacterized protein n=1 Tax=Rhizophagus irregularis (strain DAOM 181602 / DAOM 197198 / MUCL 43194) TaxID=747089 RepID=A0A2P4P448_RHIID|nr:hypothetical protein GLOIN_2v1487264 [Rhizophagus irregularis DAOM 181602=DAOM 197198]POG60157.1 hypothetical protein GLOIN_2v1487264 [Rhizophagus irregularis DAOM 181602=DAOM 197198]|eukprot:XP_025167023.1 hypothetical protein GLOIN_2v1487264 [Rhizophagus irregularis DAOM 181602=DAOM 197198]